MSITKKSCFSLSALAALSLLATVAGLSGCGGAQGVTTGASSPTSITIRHGKEKPEGGAPVAATGGAQLGGAAPAAPAGGFGTLKGRVVFQGAVPKLESLTALAETKEAICAKAGIPNDKLVLGDGNGVANVFIFVPKAPVGVPVPPVPGEPVKFDQKDCRFFPHALVIRTKQTLKILNSDSFLHNTHIYAQRSDVFNQSVPPHNSTGIDYQFEKSEAKPVEVKCDIHSWMRAYQMPLDHPWAGVTNPKGEYEIKNVPAGEQKFQVWHEGAGGGGYLDRNMTVTIKPGEVTTKDITYDASKFEG
jgi:hypothetical protein